MNQNSLSIAFVDDEKDMLTLIKAYFASEIRSGLIKLACFQSGTELINYIDQRYPPPPFSVIVSDINMPGLDGFDVLKRVKHDYPGMDVVMVSGYDRKDYVEKAYNLGAKNFFAKPLDIQKMKEYLFAKH